MNRIKTVLAALLVLLTAVWLMADMLLPAPLTYFSFRTVFVQYSGLIAVGAISTAMVLAVRPKWLEPALDGLDKMYRLHKWLGITALVASVLHWWWAQGTKWMVGWGWLVRPPRGPRASDSELGQIEAWLRSQRGFAEQLGEWAFYAAVVLIVLALVKRFPYHLFRKTHKWLAVAYLVFVFHALVLAKFAYWMQPVGWIAALMLAAGSVSACLVLLGRVGRRRRCQGSIESLIWYPQLRVLETRIEMDDSWPGHKAGQFAFVTSDDKEGAHPYTIASAWRTGERGITFISKALGDHTGKLRERLQEGAAVTVEGPYGCFDFQDSQPRQIWIGAGIGITPFIARMKELAASPGEKPIDLFHPTSVYEQAAIDKLTEDAKAAGVRLHILQSEKDGRLSGERIRELIPDCAHASIWFCGPAEFGQSLRKDFIAQRLAPGSFHQELFEMR